ncbi:unnamed protein product [Echinostoma caproni]|uniref:3'-5' exonuclease domain-containing protein n=1 Tax=Echinostoma caproni TaxID=27848 RepID=A0A183BA07_9TREM|nr:unnamed protein product [Echinostoma caproni]
MEGEGYIVTILRRGEHAPHENGVKKKCSTVLLRGPSGCMVVNPGSVWDGPNLISSLKAVGVSNPETEVTCVICTDGRAENVGCMSLFHNADMMIVGYDIQKRGDIFLEHDFGDGIVPYEFDEHEIMALLAWPFTTTATRANWNGQLDHCGITGILRGYVVC